MLQVYKKQETSIPKHRLLSTPRSISPALHTRTENEPNQIWLHIHLVQFSLDILTRGNPNQGACVLVEGQGARVKVVSANNHATRLGVRAGMPLGAAHILGDLSVLVRDERAEQQAIQRLCAWAYQFTPIVSAVDNDGVLLEIKGSVKLFGGMDELITQVRRGLRDLGYRASIAVAPTPGAASALARAERQQVVLSKNELARALSDLSLDVLRLEAKQLTTLHSIGVRTIGDSLRLPRAGLGRRTTPKAIEIFDRLIGQAPDPRPRFELPKLFQSSLELPWETDNAQVLATAGERLLHELTGYLRSCAAVTRRLRWTLTYAQGQTSHFQLALSRPSREHDHFSLLLREQLSRTPLDGKVRGLALYVDDIVVEQVPLAGDLFEQRQSTSGEDWLTFLDRLRARLGDQAVRGLQRVADHRPECAWKWSKVKACGRAATVHGDSVPREDDPERPLWLMRRPIKLRTEQGHLDINGPLRFLEERERIETGWWDGKPIGRDYFIAANPSGARLWIYRELTGEKNWYLHGIFE